MQQIHVGKCVAPKIGGSGKLEYQLWMDGNGQLYVQITKNSDGGSFPRCYFLVAKYALGRKNNDLGKLIGIDLEEKEIEVKDNDADGFLRAVLRHLLDGGASA